MKSLKGRQAGVGCCVGRYPESCLKASDVPWRVGERGGREVLFVESSRS